MTIFRLFLLLGIFSSGYARAGFAIYDVSVNTDALQGQSGNLDFQLNPGGLGAEAASATVTNFQTIGGVLAPSAILSGNASGSLPGTLMLDNDTVFNDIFQGITFGSNFSFALTLSGAAVGSPGEVFGSSFALSLYDAAGVTPLLTTDPNGSVLTINLNANGLISVETFPQSPMDSTSVADAIPVTSAVPAPSTMILLISALPMGLIMLYRMRRQVYRHPFA